MGLPKSRLLAVAGSGSSFDVDTQLYLGRVAAAGGTPLPAWPAIVNTMILGMKTDGTWPKLTDLGLQVGIDTLAGALSVIKSSVGLNYAVSSGFLQSDYIASGPDCGLNDYNNTRFIGSGLVVAKSLNIGAVTPAVLSGYGIFGLDRNGGNLLSMQTGTFPLMYQASISQIGAGLYGFAGTEFIQQAGRSGQDAFMVRTTTSAMAAYVNGAQIGTAAGASVSVPGSGNMGVMILGAANSQCGARSRAAYWVAAGISNAEGVLIRNRIATALVAIGRTLGVLTTVYEGDSLTYGTGVGVVPFSEFLKVRPGWGGRPVNVAYNGETITTGLTQYATNVQPFRADAVYSTRALLSIWFGTNDLNNGVSAITCQTNLNTYWAGARADGFRIIAFTILPRADAPWSGADEIERVALNTSIRAASANYDFLVDVAAFNGTGGTPDFSDPNNTTFYLPDKLHLNDAGEQALADWMFANINPATV